MNGPTFAPALTAPKPAPPRPAARPGAKPDADGSGLRVLTYLQLHWLLILFSGTLLGAVGSYAAWELLASKYESYGLLQVSQVPPALASQGNAHEARTDFTTYVRTMSGLIKSEFVLNAAMRDLKDLATVKAQRDPIKYLGEEVQVSAPDGSEVIRITVASHNPADANKIVNAVQKAFLAEVVQKEVATKQHRFKSSEIAMQDMHKALQNLSRRPDLAAKNPTPGDAVIAVQAVDGAPAPLPPGVAPAPAGPPPVSGLELLARLDPRSLVARFAALQTEVERTLPVEIHGGKARMRELEGQIEALKKAPIDPGTMAAVDGDADVRAQAAKVVRAKSTYDFAASAGRPDAPDVVNLRRAWEGQTARLAEVRRDKANVLEGGKRAAEMRLLAAEWTTVKNQAARYETQLVTARASMAAVERLLNNLPQQPDIVRTDGRGGVVPPEYNVADTDLRVRDGTYARLVAQHEALKLDLVAGQRIQLLQPGSSPTQKDIKKQVLGTVAGGLFGYLLVALGVVAFETVSRRVSSLADLKTIGPVAVVGVIPGLPTDATGRDPARRAAANEAIDKLRAYVAQTWLSRGATCVAVTSPLGDEGKAFTAFGLASSLAQAGYKTLLADFDLREPALHVYAGVPNGIGACEVLRGETDPRSAVVTLPSGLAFLPAGKWSDEARQAAVGGRLDAVLAKLKEPFDCVILHAHALLTVAESVAVARRCEVVLLCARYRETKLPLLEKATDRVAAMEIPYSGVVYVGATETEALC